MIIDKINRLMRMSRDRKTREWVDAHSSETDLYRIKKPNRGFFEKRTRYPIARAIDDLSKRLGKKLRILEVGCGSGADSIALAILGHDVTALDVSDRMLKDARDLARSASDAYPGRKLRIRFANGDVFDLRKFKGFDVVLSFGLINVWKDERKRMMAFSNMRAVLKPHGWLCLAATNTLNPLYRIVPVRGVITDMVEYDIDIMSAEAEKAGFVTKERRALGLTAAFDQWLRYRILSLPLRAANTVFGILPESLKMPIAPHVLILAKRKD